METKRTNRRKPLYLIFGTTALIGLAFFLMQCQGLPANVANCKVTPVPPPPLTSVPPAQEPPPAAVCAFPLQISSPSDGASVTSPAPIMAQANPPDSIYMMRLYVDGQAVYFSYTGSINQFIWMSNGTHLVEVVAEDNAGYIATSTIQLNVTSQAPGVSNIQNMSNWLSCSATLASGSTCAAGLGVAASTLSQDQATPSLDGSAAKFSLAGSHNYSNELYWNPFGGGSNVSHFTLDLYFYINQGNAPQSLEFDVNQAFGGMRWTFGTQCDFNQTGKWDIWNDAQAQWMPTSVDCTHFPSNTWIHLVWNFERVGNQVHYISLSVADSSYNIDTYYNAQSNWNQEEIDVAFQLDGNYEQQPYDVWLDEVNLNAY